MIENETSHLLQGERYFRIKKPFSTRSDAE